MRTLMACFTGLLLASCETAGGADAQIGRTAVSCDSDASRASVSRTIDAFYDALATDDYEALQRATTPDFYAFEIGKRYSARELSDLIAKSHAGGRIINWNLGSKRLRVDCSIAAAAWENNGSAGTAGNLQPRSWLESAVLIQSDDGWRLHFLHSTPKDPRG